MTAHFQALMDDLLKLRREFTTPSVRGYRATPDELEIAARTLDKLTVEYHNNVREIAMALHGTTPFKLKWVDFLSDVSTGGADLVSDIQGAAHRTVDLRGLP